MVRKETATDRVKSAIRKGKREGIRHDPMIFPWQVGVGAVKKCHLERDSAFSESRSNDLQALSVARGDFQ